MTKSLQQGQSESNLIADTVPLTPMPLVQATRQSEPTSQDVSPPSLRGADVTKAMELQWKFADETHQYIREYIRLADQKAAFFFAGSTALLTFLHSATLLDRWIKRPDQWSFIEGLSFVAVIALTASAVACLAVIFPRLKGSKRGIIFFEAITQYDSQKDFITDVLNRNIRDLIEAKLSHGYDLASVCNRKYGMLQIGIWSAALGVAVTGLMLLLA